MALPTIKYPTCTISIPSIPTPITFRVFTVVEEKLLILSMESNENADKVRAVKQVISNCVVSGELNVDKLASFELEYIFLQLRAKSVSDKINITLKGIEGSECPECQKAKKVSIAIEDIKIDVTSPSDKIELTSELFTKLKYPSADNAMDMMVYRKTLDKTTLYKIITNCIEFIYDNESQYEIESREELAEWVDKLPTYAISKITNFIENIPNVYYDVNITCPSCKRKETLRLEGLEDFLG